MSISRFKFVSPGVFVKEIDKSQTTIPAPVMGPTVIGRSVKGPMMRPVRVNSYADFVEVFGEPHPGGYNGDVWRAGVTLGPTYGAYAAKAYLAFNGPVTFVRLGGYQNDQASTPGKAGWKTSKEFSTTSVSSNGGAYGLFVAPITSSGDATVWSIPATTGALAAVFYLDEGTVGLVGSPLSGTAMRTGTAGEWVRASNLDTNVSTAIFEIQILDASSNPVTTKFNFDPSSKQFIRNKFNTNPTLLRTDTNAADAQKDYFLGETYETFLSRSVSVTSSGVNTGSFAAVILGLGRDTSHGSNYKFGARESSTGWIVAQHKGANTEFVANGSGIYPVQNLFKFVSLTEGEWNQNNLKISISDIKPSPNRYEPYGTFTVTIRKITDNDQAQEPLEVYSGLNINPISPNYIAKRIGDVKLVWDEVNKLYKEEGTYANVSKYIRVEMHPNVDQGGVDQDLLPFGFYGPIKFKSFTVSGSGAPNIDSVIPDAAFVTTNFFNTPYQAVNKISGAYFYTASLQFPELPLLVSSSHSPATTIERVYWGVQTVEQSKKIFDKSIVDILRAKPAEITSAGQYTTYSNFFSLDDIVFSGSNSTTNADDAPYFSPLSSSLTNYASWSSTGRKNGFSITSKDSFYLSSSKENGIGGTRFQKVARFTTPLFGGFNGWDITEKEPLSYGGGHSLQEGSTVESSYVYNTLKRAIDTLSDPEVVETNLMVMPGVQHPGLTTRLIETCEQRGDALAIIDLEKDFVSRYEGANGAEIPPNTEEAIQKLKERNMNSSYGCCFFPAVLARDNSANALLGMPASVVALGVLGSSEARSELWFAPAGFNRGGLSGGAAGFPVVGVKTKLTSQDRDKLYEVNINPIASFPSEGIVVFGQKTLQATPSALDRINVRRLMIYVKKEISRFANTVLFDQNIQVTWARFLNVVNPFLQSIQTRFGLTDYRVILDSTTTTPELIDRNIVYAKIFLKPARAIEFIALDFIITNAGASFDD